MRKLTEKTKNTIQLYLYLASMIIAFLLVVGMVVTSIVSAIKFFTADKKEESSTFVKTEVTAQHKNVEIKTIDNIPLSQHGRYNYNKEITMLAKVVYREARGIESITEQANIIWTILNRVDSERYDDTIEEVITAPYQFAWVENTPTTDDFGRDLEALARKIVFYWAYGIGTDVKRTLPKDYFWYYGDGEHNHFCNDWDTFEYWCYSGNFIHEYDFHLGYLEK